MSDKLEFGTRVRSEVELVRRSVSREPGPDGSVKGTRLRKVWLTTPIVDIDSGRNVTQSREGIVIGVRTLSDGGTDYDYEAGTQFYPESHFEAYLVAFAMHRKPFLVKLEDLTVLDNPAHFALLSVVEEALAATTVVSVPVNMVAGQHALPGTVKTFDVPARVEVTF